MKTKLAAILTACAALVADARQLSLNNPVVWTSCAECDPAAPVVAQGSGFDPLAAVRATWTHESGYSASLVFPVSPDGTFESAVTGLGAGHWVLEVEQAKNKARFVPVASVEVEIL